MKNVLGLLFGSIPNRSVAGTDALHRMFFHLATMVSGLCFWFAVFYFLILNIA